MAPQENLRRLRPVKSGLRMAAKTWLRTRERILSDSPKFILLLGHMRSGSTLLHHILASHPQILGCGERNRFFNGIADLQEMAVDVYYRRRMLLKRFDYIADQINHNRFLTDPEVLNHSTVHTIFLIRNPACALASMVDVLGRYYGMNLEEAAEYYTDRLNRLLEYLGAIQDRNRSAFLTYEDLTRRPEPALKGLTRFLKLRSPLFPQYHTFDFTGRRGDPEVLIHSRRIVDKRRTFSNQMNQRLLQETGKVYTRCRREMMQICGVIS